MYSYKDRLKAVKLFVKYAYSPAAVIHVLGYPKSRTSLYGWYSEFLKNGKLREKSTRTLKYTREQRKKAEEHFYQHGRCVSQTVRALGYPSRTLLKQWLSEDYPEDFQHCSTGRPRVYLTQEQKVEAVQDLCTRTGSARSVADKYGVSPCSLYIWKKQLFSEGIPTQMPKAQKHNEQKSEAEQIRELTSEVASLSAEAEDLKKQIYHLKMEKDTLQMAAEILKKGQGITLNQLTNREKAVVIDVLRNRYSLKELLELFSIAKSSYCYQEHSIKAPDKYEDAKMQIRKSFADAYESYGYRRLHVCVKKPDGSRYSEKVIRRLMREENLVVIRSRRRKYCSYQGEITPAVKNLVNRDFHADRPNQKWLTDITEFHIPAGQVYLSPMIDCYDGLPVAWTIGTSPNADLVNTMLDEAISTLREDEHPIVHSDRGCHYRWPGWIERMKKAGLTRSMSKKGCSPDNSACEGFLGV